MTRYVNLRSGSVNVQKFGRTPDIDAADTNEEVWDGSGAYTFPAAAAAMLISSSSTDDDGDPVGTGALTVRVVGLNAAWAEVTQDVTLNGQAGVSIPTALIRVYRAYVLTAGTGDINAGDIWIGTGTITSGVPAVIYAGILTGHGQTLMAVYSVPVIADYYGAILLRWYATIGAVSSAYASLALQTREFGGSWRTRRVAGISEGGLFEDRLTFGITIPAKTDIRIRALTCGVNSSTIEAGFDLALQ